MIKMIKIRKNKAYFCYGFTSAIYKTEVVKNNQICFPEKISYFEDPYFSIKLSIFANKCEIIDDAKYYYIRRNDSAANDCYTKQKTDDFVQAIDLIQKEINQNDVGQEEYIIYINFILRHLLPWCSVPHLEDESNLVALDGLLKLFENSKFSSKEILSVYFLNKKGNLKSKSTVAQILRDRIRQQSLGQNNKK